MSHSHTGMKESTWGMHVVRIWSKRKRVGREFVWLDTEFKKEDVEDLRIRHPQTGWGTPKYQVKQLQR